MGIDYSFYAEVTDKAKVLGVIREITENIESNLIEDEDSLCVEFCRFGMLYLNFTMESEHAVLEGEARTNLAGAGFHKAVVDFTDVLLMQAGLQAEVEDETEYYTERNFDKLRGHMYSWLNSVICVCERQSEKGNQALKREMASHSSVIGYLRIQKSIIQNTRRVMGEAGRHLLERRRTSMEIVFINHLHS